MIHGAVHPRSVLIDEDGGVRLTDFVVGRALTTAVAQGADSSLWRGLDRLHRARARRRRGSDAGRRRVRGRRDAVHDAVGRGAAGLAARDARGRAARAARARYRRRAPLQVGDRSAREPARGDGGRSLGARRSRRADQGGRPVGDRHEHRRRDRGSARVARLGGRAAGAPRPSGDLRAESAQKQQDARADGSTRCSPISATTPG